MIPTCDCETSAAIPPPCGSHPRTLSFYGGVHALERRLLRRLRECSYLAATDDGPRIYFCTDWVDISPAEAALLHSMED